MVLALVVQGDLHGSGGVAPVVMEIDAAAARAASHAHRYLCLPLGGARNFVEKFAELTKESLPTA
eukprot:4662007-Pyramimonas_sp.AAC.1